ncbi:hypothetical protein CISIN_1g045845mg, partial [Citrus sinensis]
MIGKASRDRESKTYQLLRLSLLSKSLNRDSHGFGFLSLDRDEDADAAIRTLDETEWNGRIIHVEKSKST